MTPVFTVGSGLERAGRQNLVQVGARKPIAGRQRSDDGRPIVLGKHRDAVGQRGPVAPDRVTPLDAGVGEPEQIQRAQRVARLNDADAVHIPGGILLHDFDIDALAPQRKRRRKSADSAAHDERPHVFLSHTMHAPGHRRVIYDSEYYFEYARRLRLRCQTPKGSRARR